MDRVPGAPAPPERERGDMVECLRRAGALAAGPDALVLEIGTGSGYGTAILSRCHRSVVTIERHPELADRARVPLVTGAS